MPNLLHICQIYYTFPLRIIFANFYNMHLRYYKRISKKISNVFTHIFTAAFSIDEIFTMRLLYLKIQKRSVNNTALRFYFIFFFLEKTFFNLVETQMPSLHPYVSRLKGFTEQMRVLAIRYCLTSILKRGFLFARKTSRIMCECISFFGKFRIVIKRANPTLCYLQRVFGFESPVARSKNIPQFPFRRKRVISFEIYLGKKCG